MRVLLISHTCQSATEGQPKAECLSRMPGLDLKVLVPDRWMHYGSWRRPEGPEFAAYGYEVGGVAWPWMGPAQFYLHWYPGLGRLLREFRPDVIDLWEEPWALVSAQACFLRARLLPDCRVISETEQNINKRLPLPFEQIRAFTLKRADYAVARNAEALEVVRAKGYVGPGEVVPNAADVALFHPMDRARGRRALGLQGFVVGYVGRLVEEKGLEDLVRALPDCASDVHLLIVGEGPLRGEMERLADELGVGERVQLVGARPLQNLPGIMNALDVLALPSRTTVRWKEQFGRVIIEANACETPVIGSDSGAIPEVVGGGGLVVPEHNPAAIAAAIERLRADRDLRECLGKQGLCQVEAHYTWQRVAERMYDIYKRVLDR